jgi:WD40 repeat protein/tRNA A-37 threonylcarbamoyl transferase component Bud32
VRVSLEPLPEEPPPSPPTSGEAHDASGDSALRIPHSALNRFGDYELLEEIARGGMGVVYKARQVSLNRIVAVKMILSGQLASAADVQRFRAEAESAARLQHPGIVAIHEIGQHDGQHFFSMDYVEGQNLAEFVGQKPLPPKQAAKYLKTVAEAIHYAHEHGILHRDLKPSNILIAQSGQPRVTDFGLAKQMKGDSDLTLSGQVLGSPNFMPPEQAAGKRGQLGPHSDVYALGAILFYMLTARPPFAGESMTETLQLVVNTEPPSPRLLNPAVPRDLETLCLKCLEKEPHRRYGAASELAEELTRFIADRPILARPAGRPEKAWRWCRRNPVVASFAAATLVLLLAVAIGSPIAALRINQQRQRAEAMLSQIQLQRAEDLLAADDTATALAYLARVLRDHPTNRVAATRILSVLAQRNFPLPLFEPLKHDGLNIFAEFSSDGRRLVTSTAVGTAQVWDATTGQPLGQPLKGVIARFSPNGQWIVTVSTNKTARVWDWLTGQPLGPPLTHQDYVNDALFSPDNRRVITCCDDKTARLWDPRTGESLTEPLKHEAPVTAARFSPDGRRVVTISGITAQVWDVESGQPVSKPLKHTWPIATAKFSLDGKRIVTASDDITARVWDAQTGAPLTEPLVSGNRCRYAEFSPDGLEVATASQDGTARLWDSHTGRQLAELRHSATVGIARFSPDGQRLVTASTDSTARIWDASTGEPLVEPLKHTNYVFLVAFSADGQRVLTTDGDQAVQVWDVQSGQARPLVLKHDAGVMMVRLSPDGRRIATASLDQTARVWDTHNGQPLTGPLCHGFTVWSAHFSPDGRRLVTDSQDGTTRIWDSYTGQLLVGPLLGVGGAEFSPEGTRIATLSNDTARVWDAATGAPLTEPLKHDGYAASLQFSPDGNRLVTSSSGGSARVWDSHTGQLLVGPLKHDYFMSSARFSPNGGLLVTASETTARIWDARTGQPVTGPLKHDANVTCAQFSPNGLTVVTASADNTARLWDVHTGRLLTEPLRHSICVHFADFSPDGDRVVTVSRDGAARIWDPSTGQALCEPIRRNSRYGLLSANGNFLATSPARVPFPSYDLAQFSADGHWLVTVSDDNAARIWEVPVAPLPIPAWLPDLAEALAHQRLNSQGISEGVSPMEILKVKRQVLASAAADSYSLWGKWFFADRATRAISPSSTVSVPEYVQRLVQENTPESLREALQLSPTNALAFARLALSTLNKQEKPDPSQLNEADFLSQRALQLSPNNAEALDVRAEVAIRLRQAAKP